jgi:two-component system cell cycle response regulator DivK
MRRKVLVIEDNEQNLYLMNYLLTKHGFDVVSARDGREGIDTARGEIPHIILLDIQLPGMSGHEVARELRRDPRLSTIPIVAVTSYAMPGDKEQVLAAGCTGYIEKPINPDTFVAQLENFLTLEGEEKRSDVAEIERRKG